MKVETRLNKDTNKTNIYVHTHTHTHTQTQTHTHTYIYIFLYIKHVQASSTSDVKYPNCISAVK